MILAFTSAFDTFSVSLGTLKADVIAAAVFPRLDHRDELSPQVGRLFGSGVRLIAVAAGPGSFTGLRVGVALAKGLAMAGGLPAVGVSCLQAQALADGERKPRGAPLPPSCEAVLPSGRGNSHYAQKFSMGRFPPKPLGKPALRSGAVEVVSLFDATHILRLASVAPSKPPVELAPLYIGDSYAAG